MEHSCCRLTPKYAISEKKIKLSSSAKSLGNDMACKLGISASGSKVETSEPRAGSLSILHACIRQLGMHPKGQIRLLGHLPTE